MAPLRPSRSAAQRAATRTVAAERTRLLLFFSRELGGSGEARRFLGTALLEALRQPDKLRRGETVVAWSGRMVFSALAQWSERIPLGSVPAPDPFRLRSTADRNAWQAALRTCLRGLLRGIEPRYEEVLRRIDLLGESKLVVAREMKVTRTTLDVLLHRARNSVRRRLETVCALRRDKPALPVRTPE